MSKNYIFAPVTKHKKNVDDGIYPNYHADVNLKERKFTFKVYQQKKDPFDNPVEKNKTINKIYLKNIILEQMKLSNELIL